MYDGSMVAGGGRSRREERAGMPLARLTRKAVIVAGSLFAGGAFREMAGVSRNAPSTTWKGGPLR